MRVAVFTGSAVGPDHHVRAVEAFGRELAGAGAGVVYGGGGVGLMGVVADAALSAGGEVIGVMPRHLVEREIAHRGLSRLDVVDTMHQRKARMAELADAFVALPGGAGTLEELFEAWTWGQLGLHTKPVALLDVDGFFAPLLSQLHVMAAAGYVSPAFIASLGVVRSAEELLSFIDSYRPPQRKWTDALESVGWVCVRDGGELLTVRTAGRDRFYLPGGKIEAGETFEAALVREVHEELGLRLSGLRDAFTVTAAAHGLARATELTMHCFYADHAGEPVPSREIAEVAWLRPTDVVRAAPAVQEVLRLLARPA